MSPAAESVIRRLDSVRQQWWLYTLLTSAMLAMCLSLALWIVFMLLDALWRLSQPVLLALFLTWLGVTAVALFVVVGRIVRSNRSLEATARRIEAEIPELESHLINIVQLSEDTKNVNRDFCRAAVEYFARRVGNTRFEDAAKKLTPLERLKYAMSTPSDFLLSLGLFLFLVAVAVGLKLVFPNWGSAASRLMKPWQFVPSVGATKILKVHPEDTEVLAGSSLEIWAEVLEPTQAAQKAVLVMTKSDGKQEAVPMTADKPVQVKKQSGNQIVVEVRRRYRITLPSIIEPFDYLLEIGDSQTRFYHVGVRHKPTVSEIEVLLRYPSYMRKPHDVFTQRDGDLEAPQFSVAELHIRPSVPIARGYLEMNGERYAGRVEQDGMALVARLPLVRDGSYTIHLFNEAGHTDPNPRVNRIRVIPDKPPTVELLKPPRQLSAAPGEQIQVTIRAMDDYGIGRVRLETKVQHGTEAEAGTPQPAEDESTIPAEPVDNKAGNTSAAQTRAVTAIEETLDIKTEKLWTEFEGNRVVTLRHTLVVPEDLKPGDRLLIRAVAWDRREVHDWGFDLRPQSGSSPWHTVRIVDAAEQAAEKLQQLTDLRTAIWRILEKQIRAEVQAALVTQKQTVKERQALAGLIRGLQVDIQKSTIDLVKTIQPNASPERQTIRKALSQVAFGDMITAIKQAEELARQEQLANFEPIASELRKTQQRIIELLRQLLDVARLEQTKLLDEMKNRPTGDLPDDTKQKYEDLQKKLEEALEMQRKVIEAAERLAKAPVEDFTEAEEQLVKALEAAEDAWSQFMNELNTDLSKLPEQDFANPSLLKELVEIQTELKMDKDSLLAKTKDIAVPLEQLGAEMAEEITTNIEKWLPDTPDRERWSQEEYLTDEGKEAPMAELPGELEDLIGELLEEEEDLFDEMEDISSSAADSLDKGAGWDVSDGPISNMSAKGATGNRLPNTSEMAGRSGEGRQGKASGEMVGEEAVGKGGRRTPSRLTHDPYVKGQIKDHSKDPVGGATGGGKESGEGGEGLEGPPPPERAERERNRLAGKQAALRNKAEAIDLQFQIMNFHHTDLQKLIELMAQVERDIRAGRYQNALRQRKVILDGLRDVKQYVAGEMEVRQDTSLNLPADIQKELLGSMQDPSPPGWEELNQRYFERLATGGQEQQ